MKISNYPWIIPTLIFTILVLFAANMHPLWGDEAETALFGRNILKCGVPCGWDGTNIMGINDAVVLNRDLVNHTSPWAQYYLTAASFKLFGQSSFTARLPFILLSILSFPLFYLLIIKLTQSKLTATLTLLVLSLSAPFILFAYQARYYSISTFAGILLLLSLLYLGEKKIWPKLLFVFSGVLFFYANYVVFAAFFITTIICYLVRLLLAKEKRSQIKKFVLLVFLLSIPIVLFTLPWHMLLKPFEGRGEILAPSIDAGYLKEFLSLYIYGAFSRYNQNNGFPVLFLPVLLFSLIFLFRQKKPIGPLLLAFLIPALYLFIMTFFSAIAMVDTSFVHTRYTMNIFPFFILAISILITILWRWKKPVAIIVLAVYLFTNFFTLEQPRSFLLEFVQEAIHPYKTPDKEVADYLKEHAKAGDTAFVSLDRDHEPLIFHLKDKIRFVNRVTFTNKRIFPKNRSILPKYLYFYLDEPDWIILYSKRGNDGSFLTFDHRDVFPLGLAPTVDLAKHYEETVLPVFFADMSRPEIDLRSFNETKPSYKDQIFIYKKIK